MTYLRLSEDVLPGGAEMFLPAAPRFIFVVHGAIEAGGGALRDDEAWSGEVAVKLKAGSSGASVWRWELLPHDPGGHTLAGEVSAGIVTREKLSARLDTVPKGALLLRCDSVAFPPGGCAYRHRHQGPGIRCLSAGGIRIDTRGHSVSYGPGGAWFENGPEPVFAQAADRPTRFIRVMILPAVLLGKSSLEYLNEEDKTKPKSQQYKIYADMPIAFAAA